MLATFFLQRMHPTPAGSRFTGSLILHYDPMLSLWKGTWSSGIDGYILTFNYDILTAAATAFANWDLGGDLEWANYQNAIFTLPPMMQYESRIVAATTAIWRAELRVTA